MKKLSHVVKSGWKEIDGFHHMLTAPGRSGLLKECSDAVEQGHWADLQAILEEDLEQNLHGKRIVDAELKATPDDILGEWLTLHVKLS
jgi:hypothetical protein